MGPYKTDISLAQVSGKTATLKVVAYDKAGNWAESERQVFIIWPPTLVGSYGTPGRACGVFVSGSYAYVADGSSSLLIFDVSGLTD